MQNLNNHLVSTLIECSPDKNIIYSMSALESNLIWNMMSSYHLLHGKYPKIIEMINFIKSRPELYGNQLFNDIKIEEKNIEKKLKGKTFNYMVVEETIDVDKYKELFGNKEIKK